MMQRRNLLILGFLLIILAGGLLIFRISDQKARLQNLLADVSIDRIEVDGANFRIVGGKVEPKSNRQTTLKVLRLGAFYQWNKEDPLFDSPDLNHDELDLAVDNLVEKTAGLQKTLGVENSLYPTAFLQDFAKVSRLNSEFEKKPSYEKAQELIAKQQETASIYESEAKSHLEYISKDPLEGSAVMFNIQISPQGIISDVAKIVENGRQLATEIERRKSCFLGKGLCIRPSFTFDKVENTTYESAKNLPEFIDGSLILPNQAQGQLDTKRIFRANTACFGWGPNFSQPQQYFYFGFRPEKSLNFGQDEAVVELATDAYYKKTPKNSDFKGKYTFVLSSLIYFCPDQQHVYKIIGLWRFLTQNKPLSSNKLDKAPESFFLTADYERKFFDDKFQSWEQLETLGKLYAYDYRQMVENPKADWAKDTALKEELLKRSLEIDRKIGDFYKDFRRIFTSTEGELLRDIGPTGTNPRQAKFVYTFRDFYGFTYLPFTKSVWRKTEPLEYLDRVEVKGAVGEGGGYMNYQTAKNIYPREEIGKWYPLQK